ncbi:uncharacterized protein PV09_01175 [Verruconis gallopava]|uniref:Uncharacterized protein n=1 Tax=Verruconis gallopava TaxID=253628 RepID=A0A0D2AND9_9PEZI|nr:uncharacterized protein PV09_01175 [Verruconis gallopava]KIW08248.1 hypothetical protein PV09_01175 [Verruconis gallopava]
MAHISDTFPSTNRDVAPIHIVDFRQQIIDNACLVWPTVALNNFRVITRELENQNGIHYHAYLMDIDLAAEDERLLNRNLTSTEDIQDNLKTPAAALAALLLKTTMHVNEYFCENSTVMED